MFRGKSGSLDNKEVQPLWLRHIRQGKINYFINTDNILIRKFEEELEKEQKTYFKNVLGAIADNFPADMFYVDVSSKPKEMTDMDENERTVRRLVNLLLKTALGNLNDTQFLEELKKNDPFSSKMEIVIDELEKRHKNE